MSKKKVLKQLKAMSDFHRSLSVEYLTMQLHLSGVSTTMKNGVVVFTKESVEHDN